MGKHFKNIKCEFCPYKCGTKRMLKDHMKKKHGK